MAFLKLISKLPFPLLYLLSDFLCFLIRDVVGYRKKVVKQNIKNSFPDFDEKQVNKVSKEFYGWLIDIFIETLKSLTITKEELAKRVVFLDHNYKVDSEQGKSFIAAASHCGNWEWVLLAGSFQLFPLTMDAAYMPLSNRFFNRLMYKIRSRFGAVPIAGNVLVKEELKRRSIQRAICMIADQRPMPESAHWLTFLNQRTAAFRGVDTFAKFFNYPVYYLEVKKIKRGYYSLSFKKIGEPPYDKENTNIIDNYYQHLAKTIKENPSHWLWTHKRWKGNDWGRD